MKEIHNCKSTSLWKANLLTKVQYWLTVCPFFLPEGYCQSIVLKCSFTFFLSSLWFCSLLAIQLDVLLFVLFHFVFLPVSPDCSNFISIILKVTILHKDTLREEPLLLLGPSPTFPSLQPRFQPPSVGNHFLFFFPLVSYFFNKLADT